MYVATRRCEKKLRQVTLTQMFCDHKDDDGDDNYDDYCDDNNDDNCDDNNNSKEQDDGPVTEDPQWHVFTDVKGKKYYKHSVTQELADNYHDMMKIQQAHKRRSTTKFNRSKGDDKEEEEYGTYEENDDNDSNAQEDGASDGSAKDCAFYSE